MKSEEQELHIIASFVHGALVSLHLLGIFYNVRRKNWWEAVVHAGAGAFSLNAINEHQKEIKDGRQDNRLPEP